MRDSGHGKADHLGRPIQTFREPGDGRVELLAQRGGPLHQRSRDIVRDEIATPEFDQHGRVVGVLGRPVDDVPSDGDRAPPVTTRERAVSNIWSAE
jgi:hypothetical protein